MIAGTWLLCYHSRNLLGRTDIQSVGRVDLLPSLSKLTHKFKEAQRTNIKGLEERNKKGTRIQGAELQCEIEAINLHTMQKRRRKGDLINTFRFQNQFGDDENEVLQKNKNRASRDHRKKMKKLVRKEVSE